MAWYHEIAASLAALFGRRRQDREMDEEMRFHLEMETRRNVDAGMSERDARRRAQRDFGGVERHKDDMRDERGGGRWFDAWSDVRFALRSLRHRPGLTAAATLTLALGIGATSTVFGVVKRVLLTPLPYDQPERVVAVWSAWKGFDQTWLSYDEWEGWKARVPAFADIGLYFDGAATIDGDSPERVRGPTRSGERLPDPRRSAPSVGAGFTADEDRPGGPRVAVLSHELWERRFGGDPSVVGKQIQISGNATTIVGVMPAGFQMPLDYAVGDRTDVWFPLATDAANQGAVPGPAFPKGGASHGFYAVARLAPGATRGRRERAAQDARRRARAVRLHGERRLPRVRRSDRRADHGTRAAGAARRVRRRRARAAHRVRERRRPVARARRGATPRAGRPRRARRRRERVLRDCSLRRARSSRRSAARRASRLAAVTVRLLRSNAPAGLPRLTETSVDWSVLVFALVVAGITALLTGMLAARAGDASRAGGRAARRRPRRDERSRASALAPDARRDGDRARRRARGRRGADDSHRAQSARRSIRDSARTACSRCACRRRRSGIRTPCASSAFWDEAPAARRRRCPA